MSVSTMTATDRVSRATPLTASSPFELRIDLGRGVSEADTRAALATGDVGFVHSLTTDSALDGPGLRLVACLTGCPWRCLYCHNPDTWDMANGVPLTLDRATREIRKHCAGRQSGGFTLSGGEPLMQDRFAARLLAAAHRMGVHTALDTNGAQGDRLSDAELRTVDLVLLDVKAWDPERHRRLTGMDVDPTLAFARRLAALRNPVWLRYVLVPGWTDDPAEIEQVAHFAATLGNVERVDVVPFHQMGRFKWKELRIAYELAEVTLPPPAAIERARATFRRAGLNAF